MPERTVIYALMHYEGAHAVYTTLEAAIEKAQEGGADYIEKWYVNEVNFFNEVVWSRHA